MGVDKIGEGYEKGKKKRMAIDEVEKAFKSQLSLHGYKGSEDLSLLWSEEYPFTALAEDYGPSPADVKLVTEAGALTVSRFMQVMGPRMMSMGQTQEKMLLRMFDEKADVSKIESLLKEKEDIVSSLTTTIETKEYERFEVVSQVRVIAPYVDVSKMDVTKVVVNGVMVDDNIVGQDEECVGESFGKV
ncbi:hypothetical protein PIB30_031950 [Stylosanthes scabra]|uniref:Uncharacterized protein n=1 Tax=Stylosanthes scabra TaxID=79078 RepID=A0ABU6RCR7_9FABA|nr:hypothetical protein [Stylosanthes scabra]